MEVATEVPAEAAPGALSRPGEAFAGRPGGWWPAAWSPSSGSGPAEAELSVVLFRGGWADVDYFDGMDGAGALPASGIASAREFGVRLDGWVARVFGPRSCSGESSV
ncbi:hypothetical protein ACIRRH_41405 [Kitasatospora sp. NPDC101235]|uniref:hypothetical protein n=1 Tax=Kitasatospora sp. NPDC101235 TaxID=3364101 RepID=UPI003812594E